MDDIKIIKTLFKVDLTSVISDTENEKVGEAQVGYQYTFDSSLPELAYALSGFLKRVDQDEDIKKSLPNTSQVGLAFIHLLEAYYNKADE